MFNKIIMNVFKNKKQLIKMNLKRNFKITKI